MRPINKIIIHCADTPTGKNFTVEDIDSWHKERGFKRDDTMRCGFNPTLFSIGYHFVIYLDGSVHSGRQVAEVGAHCSGLNSESIGICMIGNGKYTHEQWDALKDLIARLKTTYPDCKVLGHYETPSGSSQGKKCPCFDVPVYVGVGYIPRPENIA